jgi:hypothetical protein
MELEPCRGFPYIYSRLCLPLAGRVLCFCVVAAERKPVRQTQQPRDPLGGRISKTHERDKLLYGGRLPRPATPEAAPAQRQPIRRGPLGSFRNKVQRRTNLWETTGPEPM